MIIKIGNEDLVKFKKVRGCSPKCLFLVALLSFLSWQAKAQFVFGDKVKRKVEIDYTEPKKYEIGGITVKGVQYLDENTIKSLSGLSVGDKIIVPGDDISQAIRNLWKQGILGDVKINATKIEGDYIFLEFELTERPRLSKFAIRGIRKSESDDIREKINLVRGRVVTDALIKNTEIAIKKFYKEKSYLNATVNITQEDDTTLSNSVLLKIQIDRGAKIKVAEITINGNDSIADKTVKKKLKDTKEKLWWRFYKSSKFEPEKYESDKDKLLAYYNEEGFRDFEILGDTTYYLDKEKSQLKIEINVKEGPRYYFRNIDWTGNFIYPDETLDNILGINKGDIYNRSRLDRKLNFNMRGVDISSLYLDNGYLFFTVDPVEVNVENDSIDLELRIYEGPQATIRKIMIAGNLKTKDHVILREIRTLPGDKFSRANLIRTQQELSQLGYFNPETIGIQPLPNPADGTVDIQYTVEERPSDQLELSGGWGGFAGFVGSLGLTFNNFSLRDIPKFREWKPLPAGDGQRLSMRVQANGLAFQTYTFSFTEPWLGGHKPNSFTFGLSHSVFRRLDANRDPFSWLRTSSVRLSLGKRLTWPDDYFTWVNGVTLQQYDLYNYPITNQIDFSTGVAYNLTYNTTFARNSINNPLFPTSGSKISLNVMLTPPYSMFRDINTLETDADRYRWMEYHKWMFDGEYFIGLGEKLALNLRSHFGFLGFYNKGLGIGPFERFKLGGDGITGFNFLLGYDIIGLRGYANNTITPRGEEAGIIFDKFVTELRYAISNQPAATIYVLGFLEAGNNWGSYHDFNPFNVYRSAGVGVRIFMPAFGMLGFDYGYGFDEIPGAAGANEGQFHFTIGQQIR